MLQIFPFVSLTWGFQWKACLVLANSVFIYLFIFLYYDTMTLLYEVLALLMKTEMILLLCVMLWMVLDSRQSLCGVWFWFWRKVWKQSLVIKSQSSFLACVYAWSETACLSQRLLPLNYPVEVTKNFFISGTSERKKQATNIELEMGFGFSASIHGDFFEIGCVGEYWEVVSSSRLNYKCVVLGIEFPFHLLYAVRTLLSKHVSFKKEKCHFLGEAQSAPLSFCCDISCRKDKNIYAGCTEALPARKPIIWIIFTFWQFYLLSLQTCISFLYNVPNSSHGPEASTYVIQKKRTNTVCLFNFCRVVVWKIEQIWKPKYDLDYL